MKDDICPATYLKSTVSNLLKQVNETQRPVVITQNRITKAVLQDPQSYKGIRNATGLLKLIIAYVAVLDNMDAAFQIFKKIKQAINLKIYGFHWK